MASSRPWPFDEDDRPSGSVRPLSQADLEAILAQLGDDPEEWLAGTGADRPIVAVWVRASVGRPGGSAQATWRRMRASEWAAWTRTVPWRGGRPPWDRRRRRIPRQPAGTPAGTGRRLAGGPGDRLGGAVPAQP